MILRDYALTFVCDHCGKERRLYSIKSARENMWAVSRDRKRCYCPSCATLYRNTGCRGNPKNPLYKS